MEARTQLPALLLVLLLLFTGSVSYGQDEAVLDVDKEINVWKARLKANPFKLTGNLQADMRLNSISGIERRAEPFDYRVNGTINFSILGFGTSLNLNFADGKVTHRLNRPDVKLPSYAYIGMSPTYKWAKLHLGFRSMQFSPYTLSGHNFYGSGMELSPGKFRLAGFYGRLQRAVPEQLDLPQSIDPSFKRVGWGFKTGYQSGSDEIFLILFNAKDDPNSITIPTDRNDVLPAENTIVSTVGKKSISKVLSIEFDYAWSAFTRDSRAPVIENRDDLSFIYDFGGLYIPKVSTGFHKALKTTLVFSPESATFEISHEHVDPGYRTLGALFFNNDYENITGGFRKTFLSKKMSIAAKAGLQRNNLSGLENNSLQRLIGNVQVNYAVTKSWNISAVASNFSSTNILQVSQIPIITEDSLILTQQNRSLNLNNNLVLGAKKEHIITAMVGYQQFNSITNEMIDTDRTVDNFMANILYNYRFSEIDASLSNSVMYNQNVSSFWNTSTLSPTHGFNMSFLDKKLKAKVSISNAFLFQGANFERHIFINRWQFGYEINDKNQLDLMASIASQSFEASAQNKSDFREYNVRLKYGLRM